MNFFDRLRRLLRGSEPAAAHAGGDGSVATARKEITCMEAATKLQEYLDGELEGVSQEEVAYHFSVCKKCYPHLRLEERFRSLLQRSQENEACPEHVKTQVLDLLAAEAKKSN